MREERRQVAPDHRADEVRLRPFAFVARRHLAAVAHDGDAVGDARRLRRACARCRRSPCLARASRRTIAKSCRTSRIVSEDVGSSRISTRGARATPFAISTSCRSAMLRLSTLALGGTVDAASGERGLRLLVHPPEADRARNAPARLPPKKDVFGDGELRKAGSAPGERARSLRGESG